MTGPSSVLRTFKSPQVMVSRKSIIGNIYSIYGTERQHSNNTQINTMINMQTQNGERLGTFILMSPILMLRGISGRFIFFTAETARAGAADRPPCGKHTKDI